MRRLTGVGMVMFLVACATEQPAQRPVQSEPSQAQTSAVDPNAASPERQEAIERLFSRKANELQSCWTDEYQKTHDRKIKGDITIEAMVDPSGKANDVKVLKSTLNNQNIESCVAKTIGAWDFPSGTATIPVDRTVHLEAQF